MSLMTPEQIADAVVRAGFYVGPDLLGRPTLWCHECKRDSGMHWSTCARSKTETLTAATCRCPEYTTCEACINAHRPLGVKKLTLEKETVRTYPKGVDNGDATCTDRGSTHDDVEPETYTDGKEPEMPFHTNSMQCGYNPRGTTR